MSQQIQIRQSNPEESEKMAKLETHDNDVYGYLSRQVADQVGEFMSLTVSEDAKVSGTRDKSTKNFGVYGAGNGAVVSLGISKSVLSDVFGEEIGQDDDAPESVGLVFASSTEDDWDDAGEIDEEAVEGLVAGTSDESDGEEEETVEISDEELDLVA